MIPLLVVGADTTLPIGHDSLGAEVARAAVMPGATSLDPARPTAVLLPRAWRNVDPAALRALASRAAIVIAGEPGEAHPPNGVLADVAVGWLPAQAVDSVAIATLRGALKHADAIAAARARHDELTELTRIGVALSTERDLKTLLRLILSQSRRLMSADAGSLYLVEQKPSRDEVGTMRFTLAQNHTLPDLPFREATVMIDSRSIAGHVALTGQPLVIDDVYQLGSDVPYRFNRSYDDQVGYRTQSMLVLPMRSHRDEIVGVLQLINRKRNVDASLYGPAAVATHVIPFDDRTVALASAFASQAAVAIENSRLYEDIGNLCDGIVTASVHAIEQRDPTTSGHSERVTLYTLGLADALNQGLGRGPYTSTRFTRDQMRELRYACLLHDFGKVAVREAVLQKQKKLYPADLDVVRHRFAYLMQLIDVMSERERVDHLLAHGKQGFTEMSAQVEEHRRVRREELHRMLDAIIRANEPSLLAEGAFEELQALSERTYIDEVGKEQRLLTQDELRRLSIRRGNLDERERLEIESHASHSHAFLTKIPWTGELRDIPDIVWGHHEKLNGRGYPRGIGADQLRLQTRMMTIGDIFDALTASDRPYKRAVPPLRAIEILREEARDGAIDADLLETFVDAKVWETVAPEVREKTRQARESGIPRVSGSW
ncbi:MAG TPA: HD domain-containing phosphohydrolase [Gemmatimonadaceae bacterium]|nr:HD domain-containing phosphohydrolase [Gemmatimonadaceae bacterium]